MSQAPSDLLDGIPFSFFCSLLREISKASFHNANSTRSQVTRLNNVTDLLRKWILELNQRFSPLPSGTTAVVFRMLFPGEDMHRWYGMQETILARHLSECYGVPAQNFNQWFSEGSSGCLGAEVKRVLERSCPVVGGHISPLSIAQVDELLDELASHSSYSDLSIRNKYSSSTRRGPFRIICALYRTLSPIDASFLTQIILKDLRPLLYPLQETHYTAALRHFNSTSVAMLTKEQVMGVWDPTGWMLRAYRFRSNIDKVTTAFEKPENQRDCICPQIGTPVETPKSEKGRGCWHALSLLRFPSKIWAETKYDGERAQIHVQVLNDDTSRITIFSKSKRDSTLDRHAVHAVIRRAMGLSMSEQLTERVTKVKQNVILDAEMVACYGDKIDEFWRIRGLIEQTAYGVRGVHKDKRVESQTSSCSQSSMVTDASINRHLALVFFDVLAFDSKSMLCAPYSRRRALLESLIYTLPGEAMLSERQLIDTSISSDQGESELRRIFAQSIADHQEGIVLKADESLYNDFRMPWVKLKKDYIPGYGDTLDLVIVGAGWDKSRARDLRVAPTAFTTFYIGALANAGQLEQNPTLRPHFHIYFTVSYGLSRDQLEETNFLIKSSDPLPYSPTLSSDELTYIFTIFPALQPPSVILRTPLLAELYGAGFTKSPKSRNYELRFPRVTKIYRTSERSWKDSVDLQTLHKIACNVVGRDRSSKEVNDWCNGLWGKPVSPSVKSSLKRKATSEVWEEKLVLSDWKTTRQKITQQNSPSQLPRKRTSNADSRMVISQPKLASQPLVTVTNLNDTPPAMSSLLQASQDHTVPLRSRKLTVPPFPAADVSGVADENIKPSPTTSPIRPFVGADRSTPCKILPNVLDIHHLVPVPVSREEWPGTKFIENALVWFAVPPRGANGSRGFRWSWKSLIPWAQRLHSLESLLTGCGWYDDSQASTWAERGVIFVDDSDDTGKQWATYALRMVTGRHTGFAVSSQRKPIWIFSAKAWTFEGTDVEGRALYLLE